jgi:hypothetical protein
MLTEFHYVNVPVISVKYVVKYEQTVDRRDIDKMAKRGYCFPESYTPSGHSAPYVITLFPSVCFH